MTGYFAVCPTRVAKDEVAHGVGRGLLSETPGFLLARLALDRTLHDQSLGGVLLRQALAVVVDGADLVGGSVIVVDALHEKAAGFYEKYGFKRDDERLRLAMKISTARKILTRT